MLDGGGGQQLHLCQAERIDRQKQQAEYHKYFDSPVVHIRPLILSRYSYGSCISVVHSMPFAAHHCQRRPNRLVFIRIHQAEGRNKNGPTMLEYKDVTKTTA